MPTNTQLVSQVRRRLGYPLDSAPNDEQLMQLLIDNLLNFHSSLVNTRSHWSVNHYTQTVSAGTEDYIVTATDFGRPFLIYTTDSTDTYHARHEVPFSLLQDADRRYSGPQQDGGASKWSAAEMCFYRLSGSWYVRPVPIPGATGTYEVWYETNYTYGSPGDTVGLEAFHNLVRVQTAISALPFAEWRGMSPLENADAWKTKVQAIALALQHDEANYKKQFDSYRAQSSRDGVNSKLGYAIEYEGGGWGGGSMINGYGA